MADRPPTFWESSLYALFGGELNSTTITADTAITLAPSTDHELEVFQIIAFNPNDADGDVVVGGS